MLEEGRVLWRGHPLYKVTKKYLLGLDIFWEITDAILMVYENPRDDTDEFCRESYGEDNPLY